MERLWSLAGATGRNRWQMRRPRKLRKQAKTVAVGCHRLRPNLDGQEGVDGPVHDLCVTGAQTGAREPTSLQIAIFETVSKTVIRR